MVESLSLALNELECEVLGTQVEILCTRFTHQTPSVVQVKGFVFTDRLKIKYQHLLNGQALSALAGIPSSRQLFSLQTVNSAQVLDDLLQFHSPSDPINISIRCIASFHSPPFPAPTSGEAATSSSPQR